MIETLRRRDRPSSPHDLGLGPSNRAGIQGKGCNPNYPQATIRFSLDGAPFQPLDSTNGDPIFVNNPEPGTGILLGLGLIVLATHVRRRARTLRTSAKAV